ncbi:MAG: CNNM domain-containing protein [Planctomycetota bacterium]|nr:CNNM domain-containing protein [Planctomycetota bacterium]
MSTHDLIWFLVALTGLLLSALCSGLEIGLYTINRVRLAVRSGRGDRRAVRLDRELREPGRSLTTLLIGNNIANYLGSLGIMALLKSAGFSDTRAIVIDTLILVPVLFIFAETLPKDLFRTHTDRWTYLFSLPLQTARQLLSLIGVVPAVHGTARFLQRLVDPSSDAPVGGRQRVAELLREGVGSGLLSSSQGELLDRAVLVHQSTAGSEMISWREVATLPLSSDRATREQVIRTRAFSRLPVVDRGGRVRGLLHVIDAMLQSDASTESLIRPTIEVSSSTSTFEALERMREARLRLAIVVDPDTRRPVGVISVKDLVEPLIGPIRDW